MVQISDPVLPGSVTVLTLEVKHIGEDGIGFTVGRAVPGPLPLDIPTLSEWGAIIFGTLLLASVAFYIWRRRRAVTA